MDSAMVIEIEVDVLERLEAACRAAITALPRGDRGVEAAILWLRALPEACRLGLGDVTDSAPGLFRLFVAAGLIPSCPSDSAMTAAIRLIASVSPLVTQRSARTWTAWLGSACDPASAITTTLRASVTPAMLASPRPLPSATPRRRGSIRSERDRLAADLEAAREELRRERGAATARSDELTAERDRLAAELARAGEERSQRRADAARIDELTAERDRLAADLGATREEAARRRRESSARIRDLEAKRDRLAADLSAAANQNREALTKRNQEHERTTAALTEAREELDRRQVKLQDAERRCSEALQGARSRSERIKALTEGRDHLNAEIERQVRRGNDLRDKLTAAEAAVKEQTSRADETAKEVEAITTRCGDLEAKLKTTIAERDQRMASLTSAKTSLTRVRTDLEVSQAALAQEKAAHTGTRQSLAFVEERKRELRQEFHQLSADFTRAEEAAEGANRALAQICEWMSIACEAQDAPEARADAILAAIDAQEEQAKRLLKRVEKAIRLLFKDCVVSKRRAELYQHQYHDDDIEALVEKMRLQVKEEAPGQIQALMAKLVAQSKVESDA